MERVRALIILPTRDLAVQVKEVIEMLCEGTDLKVSLLVGETSFMKEQDELVLQRDEMYVYM